jgi:gamma-glutamyltranspeptidase / glutathione hydrolase
VRVVCGQGTAPQAATIETYRGLGLGLVPGAGLLAAVVPGAMDAWLLMLRDYGTIPLRAALQPAIAFARDGYPVLPMISATIGRMREMFETEWPTSASVYLPHGEVPEPGSVFRNPTLADTYERVVREGGGDRARARGPDRGGAAGLVSRLRRRGDRRLLPERAHGQLGPAPPGPAHRRRHGALGGRL